MFNTFETRKNGLLPNMGTVDRTSRFIIGVVLLSATLTGFASSIAALVAIPLILMALNAWDPIYNAFGLNTISSKKLTESQNKQASQSRPNMPHNEIPVNTMQKASIEPLNKVA